MAKNEFNERQMETIQRWMALDSTGRYTIRNFFYVEDLESIAEGTAAWVFNEYGPGLVGIVRGHYENGRWLSTADMIESCGVNKVEIANVKAIIPDYVNNITRTERPKVTSRGISPEKITDEDIATIKDKLTVYAKQIFSCDRPDANGRVYTKEAVAKACSEWVDKMASDLNEAYGMTYTSANGKLVTPGPVNNVTVQGCEVELEINTKDKEPGSVKSFLDDWVRLYDEECCTRPKGKHYIIHPAWDEILTPEARKTLEEKLGGPLENFNFYPMFNDNEESGDPCDITITFGYENKGHMEEITDSLPSFTDEQKEEIREDVKDRWDRLGITRALEETKAPAELAGFPGVKPFSTIKGDFIVPVQAMRASRLDHHHDPVCIKVKKLDARAKMPVKKPGQEENFCYDIYAIDKKEIAPGTFEYRTGLAFEIEDHKLKEEYILSIDARPRSSVSETGLILCNCQGTIDDPYRGEVKARFYQVKEGPEYKPYEPGDRIIQIKIGLTPRCEFIELGEGEELSETVRGQGGFGSSGRQ